MRIGTLIARQDVDIDISADRVVSRHMAILAMTGGGKTVAARRILRELIDQGYPVLILDPHGDYLGLWQHRGLFKESEVELFYPHIAMSEQNRAIVEILINKMTTGLSDAQRDKFGQLLSNTDPIPGQSVLSYIQALNDKVDRILTKCAKNEKPTYYVVRRTLKAVEARLEQMEKSNENMRSRLKELDFSELPDPEGRPEAIIKPGKVSILYLGGYDHLTQTTIASVVLEGLYDHRANLSGKIPPFLALVEEAHTFIPAGREASGQVPSIETIRKMITEGRKFGTGLLLVSQRPSRVDETILSQCNSFLILRLVNPKDQYYVKQIMENLSDTDAKMLPGFGPGQGIISGQAVRFPLLTQVKMDKDLIYSGIGGDENFFEQVREWKPDEKASSRKRSSEATTKLRRLPKRGKKN